MTIGYYAIVFGATIVMGLFAGLVTDPENGQPGYWSGVLTMSFGLAVLATAGTFVVDLAGGLP